MNRKEMRAKVQRVIDIWYDSKKLSKQLTGKGFNCHLWATAVHQVIKDPDVKLVHGYFNGIEHSWLEVEHTHRSKNRITIIDVFCCFPSKHLLWDYTDTATGIIYNPRTLKKYKVNKNQLKKAVKYLSQGLELCK